MSRLRCTKLMAAMLLLTVPLGNALAATDPYAPFTWKFRVLRGGSYMGAGEMKLTADPAAGNDCYLFEQSAIPSGWVRILSGPIREESHFCVGADGKLIPRTYSYNRDGIGSSKENIKLQFDLEKKLITDDRGRSWPYKPGMVDRLLMQLQLRAKVIAVGEGPPPIPDETHFTVYPVDRGGPDDMEFRLQPGKTVQSDKGPVASWELERTDKPNRRSQIWIAPALGWAIVVAEQQKNDDPIIRLELQQ